jgi:hypothetical protein
LVVGYWFFVVSRLDVGTTQETRNQQRLAGLPNGNPARLDYGLVVQSVKLPLPLYEYTRQR